MRGVRASALPAVLLAAGAGAQREPLPSSFGGDPLSTNQITVRSDKARWHANRTLLCARKKEKAEDRRCRGQGTVTP